MKINEIVTEDLSRRGFLKGLGASAALSAAGATKAEMNTFSENIGPWQITGSTKTSKFGDPTKTEINAWNNSLVYTGKTRYFYESGKNTLLPNSPVKYMIDGKNIKNTNVDSTGTIWFTDELSNLMKASTLDVQFYLYNTRYKTKEKSEFQWNVSGLDKVVEYFKNPQRYEKDKEDKPKEASDSYKAKIIAAIRPAISFNNSDLVSYANPIDIEIYASPNGIITGSKLLKSSGSSTFDTAVMNAFDKTRRLPLDKTGQVPSEIRIQIGSNM